MCVCVCVCVYIYICSCLSLHLVSCIEQDIYNKTLNLVTMQFILFIKSHSTVRKISDANSAINQTGILAHELTPVYCQRYRHSPLMNNI